MADPDKVRLYNESCPPLDTLLGDLRRRRAPSGIWRRALVLTLQRLGRQHDSLARVTTAEIITIASTRSYSIAWKEGGGDGSYPRSATARAMLRGLQQMAQRQYGRGDLTPAEGHHPDVLVLRLRRAKELLIPLSRSVAERQWRRWGAGRFPGDLWEELEMAPSNDRPYIFVARACRTTVEGLRKTLQRHRKRKGQQTS